MADELMATAQASTPRAIHPEGQFVAQCVDVVNLGQRLRAFNGEKPYLALTGALVFRTGERNEQTGDYIDMSQEFTISMGERANLRAFLESWRGKKYTQEEAERGVPLHRLERQFALLTVSHAESKKGKVYANITACVGVPKQMQSTLVPYTDYVRADWWAKRKQEYADEASAFIAQRAAEEPRHAPRPMDDDEVPF